MRAMADGFDGGMIALVPSEGDVGRLALDGGEDPTELHLTLVYLGDAEEIPNDQRIKIVDAVERVAGRAAPVAARVFGHATFNPDGHHDREPCAVYLVGDTTALGPLKDELDQFASIEQHAPYIPHITGGYGHTADDLSYTGPVVFDSIRLAIGEINIIVPLTGGEEEESDDDGED